MLLTPMDNFKCAEIIAEHEEWLECLWNSTIEDSVNEISPDVWEGITVSNEKITIPSEKNISFLIHNVINHIKKSGFHDNPSIELSEEVKGFEISALKSQDKAVVEKGQSEGEKLIEKIGNFSGVDLLFLLSISQKNKIIMIRLSKDAQEWLFTKVFSLSEVENALSYAKSVLEFAKHYVHPSLHQK